jgi:hypothetical protein
MNAELILVNNLAMNSAAWELLGTYLAYNILNAPSKKIGEHLTKKSLLYFQSDLIDKIKYIFDSSDKTVLDEVEKIYERINMKSASKEEIEKLKTIYSITNNLQINQMEMDEFKKIFQSILNKVVDDEMIADEIVDILKDLKPIEAKLLNELHNRKSVFKSKPYEKNYLRTLSQKNLVESSKLFSYTLHTIILFSLLVGFLSFSQEIIIFDMTKAGGLANSIIACGVCILIDFILIAIQTKIFGFDSWRLTWGGQEFMNKVS